MQKCRIKQQVRNPEAEYGYSRCRRGGKSNHLGWNSDISVVAKGRLCLLPRLGRSLARGASTVDTVQQVVRLPGSQRESLEWRRSNIQKKCLATYSAEAMRFATSEYRHSDWRLMHARHCGLPRSHWHCRQLGAMLQDGGQHSPLFCAQHIPHSSVWACCVSASCATAPRHHLNDRVAGLRVSDGHASSPPPWLPAMPFLHGCETLGCGAGPGIRW